MSDSYSFSSVDRSRSAIRAGLLLVKFGIVTLRGEMLVTPVPIEELVEFDMGIKITAVSNFERWPVPARTKAMYCAEENQIYVKTSVVDATDECEYRFALAHELGHAINHRALAYQLELPLSVISGPSRSFRLVKSSESGIEGEANEFADSVLLPEPLVWSSCREHLNSFWSDPHVKTRFLDERELMARWDVHHEAMVRTLVSTAMVPEHCARRRLKRLRVPYGWPALNR